MCEACDLSEKIKDALEGVFKVRRKLEISMRVFFEASIDGDKGKMEEARLEIHTLTDLQLDLSHDYNTMSKQLKELERKISRQYREE